jgi:hypothetical protein
MEYTVNQDAIKSYSEKLAADLCRQFFINKAFIAGPEILAFNAENQLNLLIVKNIFLNWQKEVLKLKSPYFDFEDDGVKQSLKTFMNKLSNHIKVYRYDFEPLVARSVSDYILLSAAPAEFFTAEIESLASPKVTLSMLKDFSRYIRVNRFIIEQVIREIEASGYSETFGGETIRFMRKAINENPDKLESAEKTLYGLLNQLPAALTDFVCQPKPLVTPPAFLDTPKPEGWATTEYVPIAPPEQKLETEIKPVRDDEFLIPEEETMEMTDSDLSTSEQLMDSAAEGTEDSLFPQSTEVEKLEVAQDEVSYEPEPVYENPVSRPLHEAFKPGKSESTETIGETITLNESMKQEKSGLASVLSSSGQAAPFRTLVPMHYRFTFINSLFDGNQDAWTEAVEKIDSTGNLEQAVKLLQTEYAERFNWSEKEDNVAILYNYVERKF